jgi:DNA-binding NtrC family response regulator
MTQEKTILIIEQEPTVSAGLKAILEKEGYSVVSANNSLHLRELFQDNSPDLAIINISLPKELGLNILRKTNELFPRIPIIAMSVYTNSLSAREIERLGASEFIAKPFDVKFLKEKIEELVEHKRNAGRS